MEYVCREYGFEHLGYRTRGKPELRYVSMIIKTYLANAQEGRVDLIPAFSAMFMRSESVEVHHGMFYEYVA